MKCRNCSAPLDHVVVDLGSAPLSNAYLTNVTLRRPEKWFPLRVLVCETCWLVQAEAYSRAAEIFNDEYAYFSSFSETWLQHSQAFEKAVKQELGLNSDSFVVEIASNDGYLLQYFARDGIPCLGIEPTASTANAARAKGIETLEVFFDSTIAQKVRDNHGPADLIIGNNVLAHVPNPLDFLQGVALLLSDDGVASFEFPHLLNLLTLNQFDTIYHEHFSYFSVTAVKNLLERAGLNLVRVEEITTHGGSLRILAAPRSDKGPVSTAAVELLVAREHEAGLDSINAYTYLQEAANRAKDELLTFLIETKRKGKVVVGYGAAAKGNTLLNYAGVKPDLLPLVVDRNPNKVGKFLPGSRIPIRPVSNLDSRRIDYILVLPWNLKDEIASQLGRHLSGGVQLVTAVPILEFHS